jgi:hypothetical protein
VEEEFVHDANIMKNTTNPDNPVPCGAATLCSNPRVPVLSNPSNAAGSIAVKRMENLCNPTTNPGPDAFTSYGTEWDWMNFFWALWAGSANRFTVAEIYDIWNGVDDRNAAYLCCQPNADKEPINCVKSRGGLTCPEKKEQRHKVGKLWKTDTTFTGTTYDQGKQVLDKVQDRYFTTNRTKYERFADLGNDTGVAH